MAKNECSECDQEIEGATVWYNPFVGLVPVESQMSHFVSTASDVRQSDNDLPFHPACFTKQTGQKWPLER
jgi:hypothetical protein